MAKQKADEAAKGKAADQLDELDQFLQEFGPGFRVKLYRVNPTTRRPEYLSSFDFAEIDLDGVRQTFGGGSFQFRAYEQTESGVQYRGSRTVDIAGPYKDLSADLEVESAQARADRLELERQELERRLATQSLEQRFESFTQDIRHLVGELRNPPPQAHQANPTELALNIIRELGVLRPHVETPPAQTPQVLEILRLGFEMGKEGRAIGAGESEPDGYMRVVDRFAPAIFKLLGTPDPGQLEAGPDQPSPMESQPPMDLRSALKRFVPALVSWAEAGKDPDVRASLIIDELPTIWVQELDKFLITQGGSAVTTVLGWYPELQPHRTWTAALIEALRPDPDDGEATEVEVEVGTGSPPPDETE